MNRSLHTTAAAVILALAVPHPGAAQEAKEIGRTTEKELNVVLSSTFGSLRLLRGEPGTMVSVISNRSDAPPANLDYAVRNRIGYMNLSLGETNDEGEHGSRPAFHLTGIKGGTWSLAFSDAVPISFDIEMGVGRGDINLSGLSVKDLTLSTGASDVCLAFDEPNRSTIENINIESGVSKFLGRNLGNANFRHFRFQGGVGTCLLDFAGSITHEVDVDVEVGMGVMTIKIPRDVGARVTYEKSWVSRVTCPDDFETVSESEYVSRNYTTAEGKMNIRVESGVGSVRIEWEE